MPTTLGENEVITTRRFEFPRELLFRAWTTPELLARWWGPNGFANTFREFDMRPGGHWRFIMHGPDGVDYPNHSVFEEIVPEERIVFLHLPTPEFRVTATFEEVEGGTQLTFRQAFESAVIFERIKSICADGNEQNFDRLQAVLAEIAE